MHRITNTLFGLVLCLSCCSNCVTPRKAQKPEPEPREPTQEQPVKRKTDRFACPVYPKNHDFLSEASLIDARKTAIYDVEGKAPPPEMKKMGDGMVPDLPFDKRTNCVRMDYVSKKAMLDDGTDDKFKITWLYDTCIDWTYNFVVRITLKTGQYTEILLITRPTTCGHYAISPVRVLAQGTGECI